MTGSTNHSQSSCSHSWVYSQCSFFQSSKPIHLYCVHVDICEVWKSEIIANYPIELEPNHQGLGPTERSVRPSTSRKWNQDARSTAAKESFSRNAAKLWNTAPQCIKTAKCLRAAKSEIRKYCSTLPI